MEAVRTQRRAESVVGIMTSLIGIGLLTLSGCASPPPQPAPTVTPDHVRGHSDNAFQKLKQEEHNRAGDSTGPR